MLLGMCTCDVMVISELLFAIIDSNIDHLISYTMIVQYSIFFFLLPWVALSLVLGPMNRRLAILFQFGLWICGVLIIIFSSLSSMFVPSVSFCIIWMVFTATLSFFHPVFRIGMALITVFAYWIPRLAQLPYRLTHLYNILEPCIIATNYVMPIIVGVRSYNTIERLILCSM